MGVFSIFLIFCISYIFSNRYINVHKIVSFMNEESTFINSLDHPSTVKLFLYAQSVYPNCFGVREAKRKLEFNSPATVLWHLDKLVEANLIEKTPQNKYVLLSNGLNVNNITVPIDFSAHIIKGELKTRNTFFLAFVLTSFFINLALIFINPIIAAINGTAIIGFFSLFYFLKNRSLKKQLSFYSWNKEKSK